MTPPAGDASMRAEGKRDPRMTTDGAAALAAKLRNAVGWPSAVDTAIITYSVLQEVITELEASPPAQDIVAEMREKVEAAGKVYIDERDKEYQSLKDEGEDEMGRDWTGPYMAAESNKKTGAKAMLEIAVAILSPTKNTAPTEAEI